MLNIDNHLYLTNPFYRDFIDRTLADMQEKKQEYIRIQHKRGEEIRQLQAQQAIIQADLDRKYRQMIGYANQVPYQQMTSISPTQWSAPYSACRDNFATYWTTSTAQHPTLHTPAQQEEFRKAFHAAIDCAAQLSKKDSPVPSIVFDGLGVLSASNLFDLAKSVLSIIDTVRHY